MGDIDDITDIVVEKYAYCEFEEFGRGPAFDCWGFVREIYRQEKGLILPSLLDGYDDCEDRFRLPGLFDRELARDWHRVEVPQFLDCAVFELLGLKMHVGVMLTDTVFMHIEHEAGVLVEDLSDPDCGRTLEGIYRHDREAAECY